MNSSTQLKNKFKHLVLLFIAILVSFVANAQLTGTKNVPGDYATLGAAIAALNTNGVGTGGVTINVIAGNAQTAPTAAGTGSVAGAVGAGYVICITTNAPTASNPLVINGNGNTVTASALATASTYNDAIFTIAGTSYVTINNFVMNDNASNTTVAASNNKTEIGVAIVRGNSTTLGSQYCTISNCTITLGQGAVYTNAIGIYSNSCNSYNVAYTSLNAATSAAGANSYNSFYGNTIAGVTTGITLLGTAGFNDIGNTVGASGQGNTITLTPQTGNMTMTTAFANYVKTRQEGIFVVNGYSFAINYNTISLPTGGSVNTPNNGISTSTSAAGTYTNTVMNNTITMKTATAAIALVGINNASGNSSTTLKYNNNIIRDTATTGTNTGITSTVAAATGNFNYNNVTLNNTTGATTALQNSGTVTTLNMNNDTCTVIVTTGVPTVMVNTGSITTLSMDNNKITVTGGAVAGTAFILENAGAAVTNGDMSNNTITFTSTSSSNALGIYNSCGSTSYIGITNNTVNITHTGAGSIYGLYNTGRDSLLNFRNNLLTLSAGSGQLIGIFNAASTMAPSLAINSNTLDLSTTAGATLVVEYIYNVPTNPDHAGIYDSVAYNVFKSTSGFTNTSGALLLLNTGYSNPLDYVIGNRTSGTITKSGTGGAIVVGLDIQGASPLSSYNTSYISNNNISNIHLSGTDTLCGIIFGVGTSQNLVISYDTISGNVTGSGFNQGIYYDFCSASAQVSNNLISSNSGTGHVTGITNESRVGNMTTACMGAIISGNKITNLSSSGASAQVYGILDGSSASGSAFNIYNDTIQNLSVSGNTAPVIYGIYEAGATTVNTYGNQIHDFSATTTTGSATMHGIYSLSGTTSNIYKNNIYSLAGGTSAGSSTLVTGVNLVSAATTYNVYNNFVTSLTAGSAANPNAIIGLYAQANGSTWNVYHNTIGIGVGVSAITSSGANFGAAGILYPNVTSSVFTLKNNIVYMNVTPNGTGISACVQRNFAATAGTPVSSTYFITDNNIYYGNTGSKNYLYVDNVTGGGGTPKNGYAISGLTTSGANNIVNDGSFNLCASTYKTFMGSGRDRHTYNENNLTAGTLTGTYAPTSTSYAYGGGVTISTPSITTDYSGVTRAAAPAIGALEFSGTTTTAAPVISYTTIPSVSYCLAVPPTLSATITSTAGVNTTTGTKPRLYYRGSSDADAYGGANNSSFNGWKYVQASNSSSPFTFTIDYSLLNHTAAAGTVISYFVVAQDVSGSPLIGYNQVAFASGYCPSTVDITGGASPTSASPVVNSYTITSVPSFTTTVSPSYFCGTGNPALLTVSPTPTDLQIQWRQDFGTGSYSAISGATTNGYSATPPAPPSIATPSATNVYNAQLSCNSSVVATSSSASVTDYSPQVLTTTPAARCGTGSVTLGATGSTGSVLQWFAAATGGYPLGTGTSFVTPSISSTTTYYVADSFGTYGNPQTVGQTTISGATLFAPSAGPGTGINFTVNNTCTIQSVRIYPYYSGATAAYSFTISVYSGATVVASYTGTVAGAAGGGTPQTVPVNFYLLPGTYQMAFSALGANASWQYGSATNAFPYTSNFNTITLNSTTFSPYYFFFYNWQVVAGCSSARTAVTATIDALPDAGTVTGTPNPDCVGTSITLSETDTVSGSGTMTSYSWTGPNGFTSSATATSVSSAVFTPTTTAASGIYSLTVTYPGTGCTSTAAATSYITVNATGTPTVTGTTNACVGATSTLSANPSGGTWTSAATGTATVDATTGTVTGVAAGSVNISYTSPCGVLTVTSFTVNTTPAAITGATTMCTSATTTLSNTVGGGTWTSGVTSVATIGSGTGLVTSVSSGVSIMTYTIGTCTATFTMTVGSTSPAAISPGSPTACVGQTTTLSDATGGGVWSSSNTAVATINSSTGVVTGVTSGSSNISYSTGCGAVGVSLTVNGTTASASNNGPICTSSTLNLTGTVGSAGTYSWSGPNGFTSTSLSPSISSAISKRAGTYSFSVTVSGCTSVAKTFAVIDSLPTAGATVSAATICSGGSSRLTGSVTNPTAFSVIAIPYSLVSFTPTATLNSASAWSADNDDGGINVSIPFNFSFYGTSYNTVNISANGYVNFGSLITSGYYTAATLPSTAAGVPRNMIALFWHDMKVTSGSVTYGSTGFAPNRKFIISYNAVPDGSTSQTNSGQIILNETSNVIDLMVTSTSTAYSMTCGVQNNAGTSALTPPGENNAAYSVATVGQGWRFETPSYSYTWSPATALSSSVVYNPTSSGLTSTQAYTVTTVDQYSSCSTGNTANTTVNVVAKPTIASLTPSTSAMCTGTSVTLTAGAVSGGTGSFSSYIWSGPGGYSSTVSSIGTTTVSVTPAVSGTYSVIAKYTGSGCLGTSAATAALTVAAQPSITSMTPSSANVCLGSSFTITAPSTGGTGTATYTWSGPDITTATSSSSPSPSLTPTLVATNSYSLNLHYTGTGCTDATSSTSVTLNTLPTISLGGNPNICQGTTTATLTYSGTTGSPTTYSIVWDATAHSAGLSDVTSATLSGGIISVAIPGGIAANIYHASLSVSNATCGSSTYGITVGVYVNPTSAITSSTAPCSGYSTNIVFTGTSGADISYTIDGGSVATATMTGGSYSLGTGAMTSAHTYVLVNAHNAVCTTGIGSSVTVTPIPMQWTGTVSTDWNAAGNWSCGFVPGASDNATIPSGTTYAPVIAASGSGTTKNLTVASGVTVTVNSSATLNIKGDFTNNGTITGVGSAILNGSAGQTINGAGSVNYFELNNASGATINAGSKVLVKNTCTITLGTLVTNDSLLLSSDSTGSARIAQIPGSGALISGNVKVMQYMTSGRRAYRFWAHPFSNYTGLNQLTPFIDITGAGGATNGFTTTASNQPSAYRYNPLVGNSTMPGDPGWRAFTSATTADDTNRLHQYQGIRVYYRGAKGEGLGFGPYLVISSTTMAQNGAVNQGNQDIPMAKGATTAQDYNMVGNPYPSPVDIGTVVFNAAAAGRINGSSFYVWNPFLGAAGQFQAIPYSTGGGTPVAIPYYLQTNDAFQVRAANNGDLLNFTEANKSASISNAYSLMKSRNEYVSLYVYDANYHPYDMLYVRFDEGATGNEDSKFDAGKPSGSEFNFYSLSADNHKLAIDARPYKVEDVIPLGLNSNYAQEYIIRAENIAVPEGGMVYLHDKFLQQYTLLQLGTEYRFSITADKMTQGENRFELTMAPAAVAEAKNNLGLKVTMSPNPAVDEVKISLTQSQKENVSINVVDMSGVSVFSKELGSKLNATVSVPLSNLAAGMYMVEVASGSQKIVQTLVKE